MGQKWPAHGFEGFVDCPVLRPEALYEAREAFAKGAILSNRESTRYQRMAPFVRRLAEALGRDGRFAMDDKVVEVAMALEDMFKLPKRHNSQTLKGRVSGFLGTDAEDRQRVKEGIRTLYGARSDIVQWLGRGVSVQKRRGVRHGFRPRSEVAVQVAA